MGEWFDNKEIDLMSENGHLESGSWVDDNPTKLDTISCDIQPANREQIFKEYGYYIDCSYRVFCDAVYYNFIFDGGLIKYNGNLFDIVKIIMWDDYLELFIKEQ